MSDQVAIGIDVGGLTAKGGLVSEQGRLHNEQTVPTGDDDRPTVIGRLEAMVHALGAKAAAAGQEAAGIGVGLPGLLDDDRSTMIYGNVRCLEGFPIRDHLAEKSRLPVRLDNDANCSTLAEYHWGVAGGYNRFLLATVGSGIGVGVMLGGRLQRYTCGTAGDLGNIIVDAPGQGDAYLGGKGSLESVASARAILEAGRSLNPPPVTVAELAERAKSDRSAAAIFCKAGWWLGVAIASWAAIFRPQCVLLAGGVTGCGDLLRDAAEQGMRQVAPPFYARNLEIRLAQLGSEAGMLGAGSLILREPA